MVRFRTSGISYTSPTSRGSPKRANLDQTAPNARPSQARPLALFLPLGDPFRVAAVAEVTPPAPRCFENSDTHVIFQRLQRIRYKHLNVLHPPFDLAEF